MKFNKDSLKIKNKKRIKKIWKNDTIYSSLWFYKFLCTFLKGGEKKRLELQVYRAAYKYQLLYNTAYIYTFFEVLELLKPLVTLDAGKYTKRQGRRLLERQQIPSPLGFWSQYKMGIRWLAGALKSPRVNQPRSLLNKFESLIDLRQALKIKKATTIDDVVQNRVFLYFRWRR